VEPRDPAAGNNILLVAGLLTVLLGTLLPLVHKELGLGSISIGTPSSTTSTAG
jgi:cytochrome c biogenesis factor